MPFLSYNLLFNIKYKLVKKTDGSCGEAKYLSDSYFEVTFQTFLLFITFQTFLLFIPYSFFCPARKEFKLLNENKQIVYRLIIYFVK